MSDRIQVSQYHPNPAKCCERCCFGRGQHADWCGKPKLEIVYRNPLSKRERKAMEDSKGA